MTDPIFEKIKHINKYGSEYWSARELYKFLGYTEYGKFTPAIERAKQACENSGQSQSLHFAHVSEMIKIAVGTEKEAMRKIENYHLSRYACYLIAQNGDPRKEEIALAQTYFAIQTRKQEMQEQDFGYMGLYGGMRQKDIHAKKKLKPKEGILDHMGSEELAANLFRATQTEARLKRESVSGEHEANKTHYEVGKKVRQTIRELGGTMPEKLPTPEHVRESKKRLKKKAEIEEMVFTDPSILKNAEKLAKLLK